MNKSVQNLGLKAQAHLVTEALCYGSCDEGWVQLAHGLHDSLGQRVGLATQMVRG